jgi:hypothetical protein
MLAVTACGVPQNSIEVKTSREAAAASCEQTGKCVKDPSGLVLYNSDLVTETFILKTPAQNPTLLAKLMNLVDEPKLLIMSGKLDPLIRGVRLVSESELCDSPKGIDGINPTISQLRVFKQGRYKACISYIGDGLFKRVYALPSIEVDTTAPEIAKDAMTKSVLTAASASLSWSKSIDNLTPESKLVYSVYVSKTNVLDSVDSVLTYGSLVPGLLVGGTSYILNSLAADTDYNVAVTVTDEAGNRSLVGHASFKTLPLDATVPTVTISSDRDPGPTNLTSVLLTIQFSEAVNAFTAAGINVNGATKGQFTAIDSDTYTLGLSTISSTVSAVVPAGSAKDAAGNNSLVSNTWSLAINGATAAPVASPVPGVYTSAKSVELSSQTPEATIYYTLDDSTPTVGSLVYSAPIFVGVTTTIKALATAPMHNDSAVVNLPFTITGKVQAPSFSVASGSYGPSQTVEISTATPGATIYYTDDNSPPNRGSSRYSAPITISTSKKITAFAVLDGWDDSESSSETYTINGSVAAPEASPVAGTYTTAQSVTLSTATQDATIYYTLDGSAPTTESTLYTAPIFVQVSQTIRAIAVKSSFIDSTTAEFPYVITGKVQAPTFSVSTGSYGPAQTVEIASSTADATIYYTNDGSTPTRESARYTSPLVVSTSQVITALAVLTDWDDSETSSANYTINGFVDPPSASIQPGVYTSPIELELSATTSGASIFYTVDGSTPNSFSLSYSAPIFVQVSQTIKAIAVKPNFIDSVPVEFSFTINGTVQKPEFSLPQGSYGPSQAVSMTTPTPNATIYYTTDGSEPTRSSTRYVGTIDLTASKTIKAFAVFADWADSAVETAQYTINGPVANPVGDPAPATYNSIQSVRLLTIPADAQIYFTIDGSDPSTSASRSLYSGGITVGASVVIKALATRGDYVDSEVVTFEYNILPAVTFTPDSITLTAGVASASITPSRTDVPIESCSITPSLPQGLDFNTSDCSITGTPAYGGPAATYAVTPANAGGIGNAATITIAVNGTDAMGAFYVNGELANGKVADLDPYADQNVLLMHFDGANGSANFADASTSNRAVTRNGNAIISNAQSMFGGSSAYFDGSGSSLWIPTETAFDFNEDFTMEGWFYFVTTNQSNGASVLFSSDVDDNIQLNSELNSNTIRYFSDSWSSYLTATLSSVLASRWVHLAVVRQAGIITIYENGQAVASSYAPKQYDVGGLYIGQQNPFRSDHWFHGYMDEIRVTKGIARYTSNFTPSTSAFGDVCYTAGVKRACGRADYSCPATGYCSALAMYFVNGFEHPGLSSSGTGFSTVDNKYYVDGSLANGLVGEIDPHSDKTVLLMHMDGVDGSATFTDSSPLNLSVTPDGNAQISTAQSKFGGSSAYFDGDGDYLNLSQLPSDYLSDNFTIEAWVYMAAYQTNQLLFNTQPHNSLGISLNRDNTGNTSVFVGNGSYWENSISSSGTLSLNSWHHVALVRTGSTLTLYHNGEWQGSVNNVPSGWGSSAKVSSITLWDGEFFNGYIDELRITKGLARYTANFTPSSAAFADPSDGSDGSDGCYAAGVKTNDVVNGTGYCAGDQTYYIVGTAMPGLNSSGTGLSTSDNKYYVNGTRANGLHDNACYAQGYNTGGVVNGTGYCIADGLYYSDGVAQPGLNSSGNGFNTLDNRYYVNGARANGVIQAVVYAGTNDSNTVLLLNGEGSDGSSTFIDSSSSGHEILADGNASLSTSIKKNGSSSIHLSGSSIYMSGNHPDFQFGNNDFTVETWFYLTDWGNGAPTIFTNLTNNDGNYAQEGYITVQLNQTNGAALYYNADHHQFQSTAAAQVDLNQWTHFALVRSGNTIKLYLNGVLAGTASFGLNSTIGGLTIGRVSDTQGYFFNGYLDDYHVSKIARYTSNFTPPTAAFGGGDTCYTAGEQRACTYVDYACSATGYCSGIAMYHIEGVPHPGLNSSGTGTSSVDNKYYVNGSLVDGLVSDNSVLLLHMNGTEGSTSFKDSTTKALTGNVGGEAKITNTQSKFGNGSAYFDGSDDYISFTSQDDFVFGTGDFTAELWFMPQDQWWNEVHTLITTADPSDAQGFLLGTWYNFTLRYYVGDAADWIQNRMYAWYSIATGSWQHLAVSRKNGTTMTFLNGSLVDSFEDTNSYTNTNNAISIGGRSFINQSFVGWIDEVRVTKGTARYTTDFTPATEEFTAYQCFAAGVSRACNYQDFGCASDGFCAANSMYYSNGIEQREFTGFYGNACYAQGYNTGGVVNGTGYCIADEKYYLQGIEQPGLDLTGTGVNTNNGKYYVNGVIANGSYPGRTALLMHMDGAEGSQSFGDSSSKALSITPMGNVATSQSRSQFGGSSAYFDGAGSYLQVNRTSHLAVGSRDFTIEVWANPTQLGVNDLAAVIDTRMNGGTTGLMLWLNSSSGKWVAYSSANSNSQQFVMESLNVASLNSWSHLALSRTGNTFRFFVNGEIQDTQDWAFDFTQDSEARALIGTAADSPGGMRNFYGYIDEVQITVGQGLYTSNFTPASEESSPWQCFTDGVSRACTQQDWTNFDFSDQRSCALWGSSGQVIAGTVVFEALGLGSDEACFNTCKNIPEVKCITMYAVWAFGGGRCTCTSSPETYSYPGFYDMVTWTPQ